MPAYRLSAYGLLIKDAAILLVRLGEKEPGCGLWTLPGGGFEPGETPEEAAIREIEEETGLTATLGPLLHVETTRRTLSNGQDTFLSRFYFAVESWKGNERPETNGWTDALEWHPLDQITEIEKADVIDIGLLAWNQKGG